MSLFKRILIAFFLTLLAAPSAIVRKSNSYYSKPIRVALNKNFPPFLAFDLIEPESAIEKDGETAQLLIQEDELVAELQELNLGQSKSIVIKNTEYIKEEKSHFEFSNLELERLRQARLLDEANDKKSHNKIENVARESRATETLKLLPIIKGKVEGTIELDPEVVFTQDHSLAVRRIKDGVAVEAGHVDLESGTFNITVAEPGGTIVVQMIDSFGGVDGEGTLRLAEASQHPGSRHIQIKSIRHRGLIGAIAKPRNQPHSGPVNDNRQIDKNENSEAKVARNEPVKKSPTQVPIARVLGLGLPLASNDEEFNTNAISPDSNGLVAFNLEGKIPTIQHVTPSSKIKPIYFTENTLNVINEALVEQGHSTKLEKSDRIVFVQINSGQTPASNVKIQSENAREIIYLGSMYLPDAKARATLESGAAIIVAKRDGHVKLDILNEQNEKHTYHAYAEAGKLFDLSIELRRREELITLRSFDALSGLPVPITAINEQVEELIDVTESGQAQVRWLATDQLTKVTTRPPAGYLPTTSSPIKFEDYLDLPQIKEAWLSESLGRSAKDVMKSKSIIVGFVQNQDFEVIFDAVDEESRVVYFDSQGQPTSVGTAGGGFIIIKAPAGLNSVGVISLNSNQIITKVILEEVNSISIVNFEFF